MVIEKKRNGNELKIIVEGRLDTNSAPELEKEILDLSGVEKIILDFENLDYISSSGLRIILKCKKAVDSTKIINCNPEIFEIMDMTGFSEMMDVEKALRKVSIDNCEKIGEGFFGKIYRIDSETIVKVYKVPDSLDMIKAERELAKKAFVMGIPTAIAYDIVKVGDLYGAVFELLNAKSLVTLMNNDEDLDNYARKSAYILKNMHNKKIEEGELPRRKDEVIKELKECEEYLDKDTFNRLLYLLGTIPETNTLLHCDFHVKNVMMQNDDLLLIDMDKLSTGHPIFEFASMYATYYGFASVNKENTVEFLGLPLNIANKLFDKTFEYYYEGKNFEELELIKLKLSIISYIQILYLRTKFGDNTCDIHIKDVEFCKQYLSSNAKKLDTLNY